MAPEIFCKSIVNSNWREYPFTVHLLLEQKGICYHVGPAAFNNILDTLDEIDFDETQISVKDWNLAQRWLCHSLGVKDGGSYINKETVDSLDCEIREILFQKYAIKPYIINANDDDMIMKTDIISRFTN